MNRGVTKNKQQGLTLTSFIIVLAVLGFFGFIVAKLWGPYYEYGNVKKAMEDVAAEPGAADKPLSALQSSLQKHFDVGYVESIDARDMTVSKGKGGNKLVMVYEVRTGFIYNIDFVIKFDASVDLEKSGSSSSGG